MSSIPPSRDHGHLAGRKSGPLTGLEYDAVMIVTDHQAVAYGMVVRKARLVVDARNARPSGEQKQGLQCLAEAP